MRATRKMLWRRSLSRGCAIIAKIMKDPDIQLPGLSEGSLVATHGGWFGRRVRHRDRCYVTIAIVRDYARGRFTFRLWGFDPDPRNIVRWTMPGTVAAE